MMCMVCVAHLAGWLLRGTWTLKWQNIRSGMLVGGKEGNWAGAAFGKPIIDQKKLKKKDALPLGVWVAEMPGKCHVLQNFIFPHCKNCGGEGGQGV